MSRELLDQYSELIQGGQGERIQAYRILATLLPCLEDEKINKEFKVNYSRLVDCLRYLEQYRQHPNTQVIHIKRGYQDTCEWGWLWNLLPMNHILDQYPETQPPTLSELLRLLEQEATRLDGLLWMQSTEVVARLLQESLLFQEGYVPPQNKWVDHDFFKRMEVVRLEEKKEQGE